MKVLVKGPDGKEFPPTNKSFEVKLYAIAYCQEGEIVLAQVLYSTSRKSLI